MFRDELYWNFEQQVVSYILVHITNIKKKLALSSLPSTAFSVRDLQCTIK